MSVYRRKKQQRLEKDLRALLQRPALFPSGTVSFCEPAKGSDTGLPDTFIAGPGILFGVELKRGDADPVKMLRPSQFRWHKTCALLNIPTYCFSIDGDAILIYRFRISSTHKELTSELLASLNKDKFDYFCVSNILEADFKAHINDLFYSFYSGLPGSHRDSENS